MYINRWLENWLLAASRDEPVVILTGARQVGKSTLLEHALSDWKYITLDDLETLAQAERDPAPLLTGDRMIIDEAQRAPKLMQAIKHIVDKSHRECRFILSGSANLLLLRKVTESLAGRAVICHLRPFTWGERQSMPIRPTMEKLFQGELHAEKTDTSVSIGEIRDAILYGWMPIVMLEKKEETAWRWIEGYVTSYLERDLRELSQIDSLVDFRRLMSATALRSGQLLNQTEVGRDISMPQATVHRYLNILEASMLLERLPAYSVNRTKRLVKSPKPYFVDSGLAAFLAGATHGQPDEKFWGALFETAVLHHLEAWCQTKTPRPSVFYWRTTAGAEVDFVVEWGRDLIAIEAKIAETPKYSDAEHLKIFMQEYPETKAAIVVHLGREITQLDEKIFAVPFHMLV